MAIGMSYDDYWYGNPTMVRAYLKADKLRQERANEHAWLNGIYIMKALDAVVGNMFRKSSAQAAQYPSKPIPLYSSEEEKKAKEEDDDSDAVFAMAWMQNMVQAGKGWGKNKS